MRFKLLFLFTLFFVATQGQAAQITASVESMDFGDIEIGYPMTQNFVVTGYDLSENINLTLEGRHTYFYEVTPTTITPAAAAAGVTVTVKCKPVSTYIWPVNIVLTSQGASGLFIPLSANPFFPENMFVNKQTVNFTANVGQIVTQKGAIRFADAEVPTDPNQPVDRSSGEDDVMICAVPGGGFYSFQITGADKCHFSARIVKRSTITNICTVAISYSPHALGTHEAALQLTCTNAGVPNATIYLHGESTAVMGDLNEDGLVSIIDITQMINLLLNNDRSISVADMNCDGVFNIDDLTILINKLLND